MRQIHVEIFTPSMSQNSLGRAYSLWLLASELGWSTTTVVPRRAALWRPLIGDDAFADTLATLEELVEKPDLAISVKVSERSLVPAIARSRRLGVPLIMDVDDPDWEAKFGSSAAERASKLLGSLGRRRRPLAPFRLRLQVTRHRHVIVSNPALAEIYGGEVVPHVRVDRPDSCGHAAEVERLVFVGTPKEYKGLEVLRGVNQRLGSTTLTITAVEPATGRMPREIWVGETSIDEGRDLVANADVVILPQMPGGSVYGRLQLPAKLVDAMLAARPVVAYDVSPVRWALGGTGVLVSVGDEVGLERAVRHLGDRHRRQQMGALARKRALSTFTPASVAPTLLRVAEKALASRL